VPFKALRTVELSSISIPPIVALTEFFHADDERAQSGRNDVLGHR